MTLDGASARLAAERLLDSRNARLETVEFSLPPSALALEPGDLVTIEGAAEGPFEIIETRDGALRRVTARTLPASLAVAGGETRPMSVPFTPTVRALPVVTAAHLPPSPGTGRTRLVLAAFSQPWPGQVQVADETTGAMLAQLERRGTLGTVSVALAEGPLGRWDHGEGFEVTLLGGHLASLAPAAVLGGSNRLAVETDQGGWEVIGFAQAELVGPGRYRLQQLLRGLEGSGPASGSVSVGRCVLVLDGREVVLPVETHQLGEMWGLRVFAGSSDLVGTELDAVLAVAPALPLPPVHLRATRTGDGDIALGWIRCSLADGWGVADTPLEHAPERYRVVITEGGNAVRTIESDTAGALYSKAEQIADFGALPNTFHFSVAQISPVLGEGHAAQGEFHD